MGRAGWSRIKAVRRGGRRCVCGACEPVSQHGAEGLHGEPWIVALSTSVRLTFLLALPGVGLIGLSAAGEGGPISWKPLPSSNQRRTPRIGFRSCWERPRSCTNPWRTSRMATTCPTHRFVSRWNSEPDRHWATVRTATLLRPGEVLMSTTSCDSPSAHRLDEACVQATVPFANRAQNMYGIMG